MSENGNASPGRSRGLWLIALLSLFILLAAVAGIVWTRRAAGEDKATSGASGQELPAVPLQESELANAAGAAPRATSAPPLAPTAIATSRPTEVPLPSFDNPTEEAFVQDAQTWNVPLQVIDQRNSGLWDFVPNSFIHPIALELAGDTAYLLDAGRILSVNRANPSAPTVLLSPGDEVSEIRVIEPVDLTVAKNKVYVLDRAGDVYRYDMDSGSWELDRYDRPTEKSSGHYFVALDAAEVSAEISPRTLLETNYKFVMQYGEEANSLWNLPEGRAVDVSTSAGDVYVLQREMSGSAGSLLKFRDTRSIKEFSPSVGIDRPRQLAATETGVFVLDQAGRRLLVLEPLTGDLRSVYQLPQVETISVFALDHLGRLVLAGRDRLYWVEQPEKLATVPAGHSLGEGQPHDPSVLQKLSYLSVPIGGTNITLRDFQMPGAPRHYRLGVHEGLDFYWQPGTKVIAVGDGTVIRADLDYVGPNALDLAVWWNETQDLGYTTPERLDDYLGRQVWIDHGEGVISRYGHLRAIEPGIVSGVEVAQGQIIGEVGNSGSPASLESESSDAHLHFELWLGDHYLGQYMRPIEIREWIESIFTE